MESQKRRRYVLSKKWLLYIIQFFISGLIIYGLYKFFENHVGNGEIDRAIVAQTNLFYIIPFCLLIGFSLFCISLRFYYLLNQEISLKDAITITCLGAGANMLLPARGGDLLRVSMTQKSTRQSTLQKKKKKHSYFSIFLLILIERYLDFFFVLLSALIAIMIMIAPMDFSTISVLEKLFFPILLLWIAMFLLIIYVAHCRSQLKKILSWLKGLKEKFFRSLNKNKNSKTLHRLEESRFMTALFQGSIIDQIHLSKGNLYKVFFISMFCWFGPYALSLSMIYLALEIPLTWPHLMFIQFTSVVGLLIPAAPSGIGAVHASIVSGFYLTDFSEKQGLLFATAFHLLNTLSVIFFSIFALIRKQVVSSHAHKK